MVAGGRGLPLVCMIDRQGLLPIRHMPRHARGHAATCPYAAVHILIFSACAWGAGRAGVDGVPCQLGRTHLLPAHELRKSHSHTSSCCSCLGVLARLMTCAGMQVWDDDGLLPLGDDYAPGMLPDDHLNNTVSSSRQHTSCKATRAPIHRPDYHNWLTSVLPPRRAIPWRPPPAAAAMLRGVCVR